MSLVATLLSDELAAAFAVTGRLSPENIDKSILAASAQLIALFLILNFPFLSLSVINFWVAAELTYICGI